MQLFHENGNHSIEGIDVKHACYGGTFALFTAFDRINSKYWDGRYCIVISADIAEYEQGPARPSGGCGAVAVLLGKGGCIDLSVPRASYKAHEYDFYKPHLDSPYPVVDGPLSNRCYLNALDSCFTSYRSKMDGMNIKWRPIMMDGKYDADNSEIESMENSMENMVENTDFEALDDTQTVTPNAKGFSKNIPLKSPSKSPEFWVFHAPYNKLVSKTFGRVLYHDFLTNPAPYYQRYADNEKMMSFLKKYESVPYSDTIGSREVIKGFERIASEWYKSYVAPSTMIPKQIGNCYTASIFMGLLSVIVDCGACDADTDPNYAISKLMGKEIQMFSYGSGTMASLYSLKVMDSDAARQRLLKIVENNDMEKRLSQRVKTECAVYTDIMNKKQEKYRQHSARKCDATGFVPEGLVDINHFYDGTYYLERIDAKKRRYYAKFENVADELLTEIDDAKSMETMDDLIDFKMEKMERNKSLSPVAVIREQVVKENIARFKVDDEEEMAMDCIPDVGHIISDAVLNGARGVLVKAQGHGLSKQGAIQIDKVLTKTHHVVSKCSNS